MLGRASRHQSPSGRRSSLDYSVVAVYIYIYIYIYFYMFTRS